jgi:hypothetical protein
LDPGRIHSYFHYTLPALARFSPPKLIALRGTNGILLFFSGDDGGDGELGELGELTPKKSGDFGGVNAGLCCDICCLCRDGNDWPMFIALVFEERLLAHVTVQKAKVGRCCELAREKDEDPI